MRSKMAPACPTINGSTGAISGTPGAGTGGVYVVTVTAANGVAPNATQTLTITVAATAPLLIPTLSHFALMLLALLAGGVGLVYSRRR